MWKYIALFGSSGKDGDGDDDEGQKRDKKSQKEWE